MLVLILTAVPLAFLVPALCAWDEEQQRQDLSALATDATRAIEDGEAFVLTL